MNHASGAVTPLDPEMIQVDDAVGQRAERRGLANPDLSWGLMADAGRRGGRVPDPDFSAGV
jgi:hypothetical protein